jgi:hypothetical protein
MSKKPNAKGRGIPVDLEYELGLEYHGSEAHRASASGAPKAPTLGDSFVLSSKPMSTKARKQEAEAEAARIIAEAKKEAAAQAESDRLYKEYMKLHQPPKPPKSVTCALCKKTETVGEAIAHKWKKHDFFANQAICAACDAETVPFTASPKFVWKREPNMLSARQARLQKLLDHASAPPNALKANIAETAVFDLTPSQRMRSLHGIMHKKLSAAFLTPPVAGIEPLTKAQLAKFTDETYKRNRGGTKSKSKSKSKRSKSRSRSRAHRSKNRAHR